MKQGAILISAIAVLGFAAGAIAGKLWELPWILWIGLGVVGLLLVVGVGLRRVKETGVSTGVGAEELLARAAEQGRRQEEIWRVFSQELRGRLANIRAAAETMEAFPQLDSMPRLQLQETILEESKALSESVDAVSQQVAEARERDWQLERITGRDLALRIASHLEDSLRVRCVTDLVDAPMWVQAESNALVEALGDFISQLRDEFGVGNVRLRLREEDGFATLDLIWGFDGVDVDALYAWQNVVMTPEEGESAPRLKVVARMHGGESWFNLDRNAANAYLRILVPVAATAAAGP